jgi:YebC/PmpR family DNA-binding regulatory protein
MAGHNKWSKIKRQKAVTDAKKSNIFSKLSRAITVAARQGGGDSDANIALRTVIEKAKAERMPKENIQRAIDKGRGTGSGASYEEAVYEGYGPQGVAFLIKALTDNKNRTVSEMRVIFNKYGGSLGASGSTAYIVLK